MVHSQCGNMQNELAGKWHFASSFLISLQSVGRLVGLGGDLCVSLAKWVISVCMEASTHIYTHTNTKYGINHIVTQYKYRPNSNNLYSLYLLTHSVGCSSKTKQFMIVMNTSNEKTRRRNALKLRPSLAVALFLCHSFHCVALSAHMRMMYV